MNAKDDQPDARPPSGESFGVVSLDDLARVRIGEALWRPVRRAAGVTAFGVNAYTAAESGDELIERHDELSPGSGGHDELYVVLTGRVRFEIDGQEVLAPPTTLVHIRRGTRRQAWAAEPDTTVLVVGGVPDSALPVSPFEYWYAAEPAYQSGDYDEAIRIASAGLRDWPEHHHLRYQLACFHALAGRPDEAIDHLRRAVASDAQVIEWARDDTDLDSIRGREDYPA